MCVCVCVLCVLCVCVCVCVIVIEWLFDCLFVCLLCVCVCVCENFPACIFLYHSTFIASCSTCQRGQADASSFERSRCHGTNCDKFGVTGALCCLLVCVYVYCIYVCMYACMYVYMYVCVCVCMCACVCLYVYMHDFLVECACLPLAKLIFALACVTLMNQCYLVPKHPPFFLSFAAQNVSPLCFRHMC